MRHATKRHLWARYLGHSPIPPPRKRRIELPPSACRSPPLREASGRSDSPPTRSAAWDATRGLSTCRSEILGVHQADDRLC